MKVYTIGRSADCAIVFDDPMISRRHALLKVYPLGKMELVDLSQNGTFVNGVKLKSNIPFPITRKDVVNLAQVKVLDWSQVPNPAKKIKIAIASAVVLLVLVIGACFVLPKLGGSDVYYYEDATPSQTAGPSRIGNTGTQSGVGVDNESAKDISVDDVLGKERTKKRIHRPKTPQPAETEKKEENKQTETPADDSQKKGYVTPWF